MVTARPSSTDAATDRSVPAPIRAAVVISLLFLFLVGVGLLEAGINALGSDIQEELFSSVSNPLAGLFVGILATVLAQSSSVTTSTIVGLVGAGLLGIDDAVPMIMGANIGTTVTNTLASLGHLRRPQEFRLAFAAATVHDAFNLLAVSVLLPVELLTGVLSNTAEALTDVLLGGSGAEFDSPFKAAVKVPVGWAEELWGGAVGLDGTVLGIVLVITGLAAIFLALTFVTRNMRQLIAARVERSINAMLGRGGGMPAILLGLVITVAVQSSSITTSIMIPLSAAGVVSLAMSCLVTDGDIGPIGDEVRTTDWAINGIEETVRRELVVHSAVRGGADVGAVLASLLMVKKLERVGDQAKNVCDLAAEGVRFSDADDYERFLDFRSRVSQLFTDTAAALAEPDTTDVEALDRRAEELMSTFDDLVNELIHADAPARYAVPRAMLFRYLKRICANLTSVATTAATGIDRVGDVDLDE